jgi:glutathione-regulated potassium-efflux system ancillary protein KefG
MARVLILFAHPALEKSRVHRRLVAAVPDLPGLRLHDLYEAYPQFDVDVEREQALLLEHDVIVLQHPFFWYSTPAILKQWQDLVLTHGWAYGSQGKALAGKRVFNLMTAGGGERGYAHDGHNRYTVRELLAPIEQTMRLCNMQYLPPYVIYGTHWMDEPEIDAVARRYRELLAALHDDRIDYDRAMALPTLNLALDSAAAGVTR